jgi:hypothetical protein
MSDRPAPRVFSAEVGALLPGRARRLEVPIALGGRVHASLGDLGNRARMLD